jgi:hypothetical protein
VYLIGATDLPEGVSGQILSSAPVEEVTPSRVQDPSQREDPAFRQSRSYLGSIFITVALQKGKQNPVSWMSDNFHHGATKGRCHENKTGASLTFGKP